MSEAIRVYASQAVGNGEICLPPDGLLAQLKLAGDSGSAKREYTAEELYLGLFEGEETPVGFEVSASDGFYSFVPWQYAATSVFRFPQSDDYSVSQKESASSNPSGESSRSQQGLRLVVQNQPNACLNVKAVVQVEFCFGDAPDEPVFGSKRPGNPKVCKNQK